MARHGTSEGEKLKKHLGLSEKSFINLSEREQAKIGGRLMEIFHTLSDGAVVPLLNFCLEECHVRELCILKGIKTTDPSSSQLKIRNLKKEEPKEEPNDELIDEPKAEPKDELLEDSDVDDRMAEANADIEEGVWNTRKIVHGNDTEEIPLDREEVAIKEAEKEKTKTPPKTERPKIKADAIKRKLKDFKCSECGQIFNSMGSLWGHISDVHSVVKEDHVCSDCGKTFTRKKSLKRHRESLHSEISFRCRICSQTFTNRGKMTYHIKKIHGFGALH